MTSRCPWVPNIPTHFVPLDNEDLLQPHFSQLCSVLFSSQFSSEKTICSSRNFISHLTANWSCQGNCFWCSLSWGSWRGWQGSCWWKVWFRWWWQLLILIVVFLLKHDGDNDDCDEDENKMLNSGCSCQEKYFLHNAVDLQPWRRKGGEINMRKQSTSYTTARNIYIFI